MIDIRSTRASRYVHKLRLEAHEGAHISVEPTPTASSATRRSWVLVKFIGALGATSSLLAFAAHQLVR